MNTEYLLKVSESYSALWQGVYNLYTEGFRRFKVISIVFLKRNNMFLIRCSALLDILS